VACTCYVALSMFLIGPCGSDMGVNGAIVAPSGREGIIPTRASLES
jgi:hypothetical protein